MRVLNRTVLVIKRAISSAAMSSATFDVRPVLQPCIAYKFYNAALECASVPPHPNASQSSVARQPPAQWMSCSEVPSPDSSWLLPPPLTCASSSEASECLTSPSCRWRRLPLLLPLLPPLPPAAHHESPCATLGLLCNSAGAATPTAATASTQSRHSTSNLTGLRRRACAAVPARRIAGFAMLRRCSSSRWKASRVGTHWLSRNQNCVVQEGGSPKGTQWGHLPRC